MCGLLLQAMGPHRKKRLYFDKKRSFREASWSSGATSPMATCCNSTGPRSRSSSTSNSPPPSPAPRPLPRRPSEDIWSRARTTPSRASAMCGVTRRTTIGCRWSTAPAIDHGTGHHLPRRCPVRGEIARALTREAFGCPRMIR